MIDTRERGCLEINDWLDQPRASFETAASQLPQDEGIFLMPSKAFLMLRSAQKARLEARALPDAGFSCPVHQFPDSLESGHPGLPLAGNRGHPLNCSP